MKKSLGILTFLALVAAAGAAHANSFIVLTDLTWRAIGPVGNLQGTPITTVGLAWEAANPGWNSSVAYDDSDANGWAYATQGIQAPGAIWIGGDSWNGPTPAYFRKEFTYSPAMGTALLYAEPDDDAQVYVNGVLVVDDQNVSYGVYPPGSVFDITAHLVNGNNVVAAKVHDSFGGQELWAMSISVTGTPPVGGDSDEDGVDDDEDACLGTAAGAVVDANGCSGAQQVAASCPAGASYKNHGAYVSCVTHATQDAVKAGLMTAAERTAILTAAAQSDIGK